MAPSRSRSGPRPAAETTLMNTLALPPLKEAAPSSPVRLGGALRRDAAPVSSTASEPARDLAHPTALPGATAWQAAPSRRWALLAVAGVHVAAVLLLAQAGQHFRRAKPPAPVQVRLLEQPPAPRETLPQAPRVALPVQVSLALPLPEFVSAQPRLEVAVQPPPANPTPPPLEAPAPRAVSLAAQQPKPVSAGSLRYRVEPAIEVPRLSRRAGESGTVQLRVVFDTEGRPRRVEMLRSSGFARLDAQALEAMQQSRIQPYLEDGRAIEVVAVATLEYELN